MAKNNEASARIASSKRMVIKIGSALLLNQGGDIAENWLSELGSDIANLRAEGVETCIVSSGAVGLGRAKLGLSDQLRLEEKQAAATGHSLLIEAWQRALAPHGLITAQVLLTLSDTETAKGFLTAVDSAIVMHNASTQFADGGEFDLGTEMVLPPGVCVRAARLALRNSPHTKTSFTVLIIFALEMETCFV